MSLAEVIKTALDQMQYIAKTETVIGEPITAGNVTLIPVSRISIGFAAGGGGISITPVAFISIKEDRVQVHPVSPSDPVLGKIIAAAPEIAKKISQFFSKKDDSDKEK